MARFLLCFFLVFASAGCDSSQTGDGAGGAPESPEVGGKADRGDEAVAPGWARRPAAPAIEGSRANPWPPPDRRRRQ